MTTEEEEIKKKLETEFKQGIQEIEIRDEHKMHVHVEVDALVDIATFLKHDLGFTIPNMCTGIDQKEHMDVVWHVGGPHTPVLIALRTEIDRDDPTVPSLKPIWEGMNWHERETYDLLGVTFEGHPDLRRILMPENWEGHPLREDYVYKKPTYRKPEDFE